MIRIIFISLLVAGIVVCFLGCKKESLPKVTIKLEYLAAGGYYNDDIEAVPSGLTLGSNGPYVFDINKTYTLEYKAGASFNVIRQSWKPASAFWTIRCWVEGNRAYMQAIPGTKNP